jgi:archaellum component FlaC
MSSVAQRLDSLKEGLNKIQRNMNRLKQDNDQLRKKLSDAETALKEKSEKLSDLEREYERLKLAKALVSKSGDKAEMKFRVNELVKEIDKCIALLNR